MSSRTTFFVNNKCMYIREPIVLLFEDYQPTPQIKQMEMISIRNESPKTIFEVFIRITAIQ